jgi:hypothetical protein
MADGYICVECNRVDRDRRQFCETCWYCTGCIALDGHDPDERCGTIDD